MKKIFVFLLVMISSISFSVVNANTINSVIMDIYVDDMGDAHVTEKWDCYANDKTEWYHVYNDIGKSEITNFTVVDEDMITYESVSNWNVNGSFDSKKYKCGINKTSQGSELCFGISEYNSKKNYTLNYTITNFVSNLTDSQMIYWTLVDFSQEIGMAYIRIHSNFEYADTVGVWGFGNYGGTAYVYDGYIEMQSPGNLEENEYMTILVQFPQNTFKGATNDINNNFEYYLNLAKDGSVVHKEKESNTLAGFIERHIQNEVLRVIIMVILEIIFGLINIIIILFLVLLFPVLFVVTFLSLPGYNRKIVRKEEVSDVKLYKDYYRDIPCNKDLFRAYYFSYEFNIINKKSDLLGAVMLDWLRKKKIIIKKKEVGFIRKKEENCIILQNDLMFENELEQELYDMVYASSKDGILEKKEFEKWCTNKYNKLFKWFEKVIEHERKKLLEEGIIIKNGNKYEIVDLEAFKQEGKNIKGLKNYLKNYTLISERKAIEVTIFEEYLIFAQMLGIAKTVLKEFKDLYPDIVASSNFSTYDNIGFVYDCSHSGITKAYNARSEASSRASSYSSGGGGFSSGGGGGGSFGGGRRRLTLMIIGTNLIL